MQNATRVAPCLERVEAVAPTARAHADWSEKHARPATEFVEALRDHGLFGLLAPQSFGGAGLSPWEIGPVIEAMARVDPFASFHISHEFNNCFRLLPLRCAVTRYAARFTNRWFMLLILYPHPRDSAPLWKCWRKCRVNFHLRT